MNTGSKSLEAMWEELVRLCNEQFDSPQFKRLLGARESLLIDRVYRGHLADMLEALS